MMMNNFIQLLMLVLEYIIMISMRMSLKVLRILINSKLFKKDPLYRKELQYKKDLQCRGLSKYLL
jgi:hypothetical protein